VTDDPIRHGTPHGYKPCHRRPEGACDDCRKARAAYMKRWRAERRRSDPDGHQTELAKEAARQRAHRQLARAHPAEYLELVEAAFRDITAARRAP